MLIVFTGLPCSGKSTLTKSLGKQLNKPFFLEPEEDAWPQWITQKNSDQFSALNWFRAARVPIYKMAAESSKKTLTFIDSFYDVLIHYYLENCVILLSYNYDDGCNYSMMTIHDGEGDDDYGES
jgi:tRNA uridine 5-carbamoylmethylation protein Kti12